jgi:hypothetical protein
MAYFQPRLGIEWAVQVFTGVDWEYGKATRYGGNGLLYVEQLGSRSMSTGRDSSHEWDPTLHVCSCGEQSLIKVDATSGLVSLVRPLDHSTESISLFVEIYRHFATEEVTLAACEGTLPPVLAALGDYDFDARSLGDGDEPHAAHGTIRTEEEMLALEASCGNSVGGGGAGGGGAGGRSRVTTFDEKKKIVPDEAGLPPVPLSMAYNMSAPGGGSGATLHVHWRGLIHSRGTYPRECVIVEYYPGEGIKRDYGPDPRRRPKFGGLSDCAVSAKIIQSQEEIMETARFRRQSQLVHENIREVNALRVSIDEDAAAKAANVVGDGGEFVTLDVYYF